MELINIQNLNKTYKIICTNEEETDPSKAVCIGFAPINETNDTVCKPCKDGYYSKKGENICNYIESTKK